MNCQWNTGSTNKAMILIIIIIIMSRWLLRCHNMATDSIAIVAEKLSSYSTMTQKHTAWTLPNWNLFLNAVFSCCDTDAGEPTQKWCPSPSGVIYEADAGTVKPNVYFCWLACQEHRSWRILKIWRRVTVCFDPLKCHSKLLLDKLCKFYIIRDERLCQKWKVKLIFEAPTGCQEPGLYNVWKSLT